MSAIAPCWLEDYVVGSVVSSSGRTVTEADIVLHAGQTGDFYPHHMDAVWAATQAFERRMAHGTLVMAMGVGLLAGAINTRAISYGYNRVRFVAPVFIGDTITSHATISGIRPHPRRNAEVGYVDEEVRIVNQRQETVVVLTHVYLVRRRGSEDVV